MAFQRASSKEIGGTLKQDVIRAVKEFFATGIMPEGVNDTIIVLIPKTKTQNGSGITDRLVSAMLFIKLFQSAY